MSAKTFENAKVGDRVCWFTFEFGNRWGKITEIQHGAKFPIVVTFDAGNSETFTKGGLLDIGDVIQSLFWGEIHIIAPEKPEPVVELYTPEELPSVFLMEGFACYGDCVVIRRPSSMDEIKELHDHGNRWSYIERVSSNERWLSFNKKENK